MGDILKPVVLRILLDHQHIIGNEADVPQIPDMNHFHAVLTV